MRCFHPLVGMISTAPNKNGNFPLIVKGSLKKAQKEGWLSPEHIRVPCGKCIGCRINYSAQWAIRICHEAQMAEEANQPCLFVTLTYDQESLPTDECISVRHVQLFIKSLRKHFTGRKIRYFAVGEYGEKLKRPHYHVILFNVDFEDKKLAAYRKGMPAYVSETLNNIWKRGRTEIGTVTYESAAYCARYSTKKQCGRKSNEHYYHVTRYGEELNLTPEFSLMSLKPAIGYTWLEKYGKDIFPCDFVLRKGKTKTVTQKVPTFYYRKLQELDPETALAVKEKRVEHIKSSQQLTHERLMDMKKCLLKKYENFTRDYEESEA